MLRIEGGEKFNFHQITLPVLAKYQLAKKLSLTGGGYLSANLFVGRNYGSDEYKKIDLGVLLGLEYQLTKRFLVDIRYNYGLTNMISDNPTSTSRSSSNYKRVLNLGIGYRL